MALEPVEGLRQAYLELGALPNAARWEFADMLGRLGRDILAVQRARVARDTGALAAGLTSQLLVDDGHMRLRVGLIGTEVTNKGTRTRAAKAGRNDPRNLGDTFYGRIVEFGRHAQNVAYERRRRVDGALRLEPGSRGRRKRIEDIAVTDIMRVSAMAPRPFVNVGDGVVDALIDQRTGDFWERTLNRADIA